MTLVTCRNCQEDFDADDGGCPGCGHPRVEPQGHPIEVPSCADCGTPRRHFNGLPLADGSPCLNCGSLVRRLPRREGQIVGDTRSAAVTLDEADVDEPVKRSSALGVVQGGATEGEGLPRATTHSAGAATRASASSSVSEQCEACIRPRRQRSRYCSDACRQFAYRRRTGAKDARRRRPEPPEQKRAHNLVADALRHGRMERQPCEVCGDPKAQAHHDDYSKPLDVRWLCRPHHEQAHGRNGIVRPDALERTA